MQLSEFRRDLARCESDCAIHANEYERGKAKAFGHAAQLSQAIEPVAYIVEYRTSEADDWQRQGRIFEGPRAREYAESVRDMAQEAAGQDGEARLVPLYR